MTRVLGLVDLERVEMRYSGASIAEIVLVDFRITWLLDQALAEVPIIHI